MNERRFQGKAARLHAAERVASLEVDQVVALALEGLTATTVLDIGTGTGIFAEAFARLGLKATGIDANPDLLRVARSRLPSAQFCEGTAENLPFEDVSFDLAFLGHLLHEVDVPLDALKEARRVARGRVVVLEWPYRAEKQGPPLDHRLRPETILSLADTADFHGGDRIKLKHMELYRLTP